MPAGAAGSESINEKGCGPENRTPKLKIKGERMIKDHWYKRNPRDFYEATRRLSLEERGAYCDIIDLLYMHGGDVADDEKWMAFALHISTRKWRIIRQALVDAGKIKIVDGKIVNERVSFELDSRAIQSRVRSESATNRERTKRENSENTNKNNEAEAQKTHNIRIRDRIRDRIEQTDRHLEQESARGGRLSDGLADRNFIDCKTAFNGSTEAMLAEVERAMHPYGERAGAAQWLATVLRANGQDAVAQAFTMLQTARAEGKAVARPLSWLAKTAATLKADGAKQKPIPVDRAAAKREADLAYLKSIGAM